MKTIVAATLLACVGCASGVPVRQMAGDGAADSGLEARLRSDDPIEDLRLLQRSALKGDGRSALQWLGRASDAKATLSQRMRARVEIEALLDRGPILDRGGEDVTAQVREQLASSWRFHEPVSAERARRIAAGERSWAPSAAEAISGEGYWHEERGAVWAGGHDRVLMTTGLLAFLGDGRGEPVFRGTHLWMKNISSRTVYVSCAAALEFDRALAPGEDLVWPLDLRRVGAGTFTTGADIAVRAWRPSGLLAQSAY